MTVRCFVDASVLLQARDARDPLKRGRAAEWLERLGSNAPAEPACRCSPSST